MPLLELYLAQELLPLRFAPALEEFEEVCSHLHLHYQPPFLLVALDHFSLIMY